LSPPDDDRARALRWLVPLLLVLPLLSLWKRQKEKEAAEFALAQQGAADDPAAILRKPPEELLCAGDAPALCAQLETWRKAADCAAKRTALGELKAAAAQYTESPSFMKLAGGVVNVEAATRECRDVRR
jgi:hypothetical protein